jgi:hypothetical protein
MPFLASIIQDFDKLARFMLRSDAVVNLKKTGRNLTYAVVYYLWVLDLRFWV